MSKIMYKPLINNMVLTVALKGQRQYLPLLVSTNHIIIKIPLEHLAIRL